MTMIFVKINLTFTFLLCLILYANHQNYRPRQIIKMNMDPPICCCHTDTLLSFDTIIHYVLLYFKCLYHILFSICSDSQLENGLNAQCKINRMFNNGDISQHQKNKFYNLAQVFSERAFKYALDNFPHSDELLKHTELGNTVKMPVSIA